MKSQLQKQQTMKFPHPATAPPIEFSNAKGSTVPQEYAIEARKNPDVIPEMAENPSELKALQKEALVRQYVLQRYTVNRSKPPITRLVNNQFLSPYYWQGTDTPTSLRPNQVFRPCTIDQRFVTYPTEIDRCGSIPVTTKVLIFFVFTITIR